MPLLYIRCKNVVPTTYLPLEEEDEESEKIEGGNGGKWKNTMPSVLCRLVPKDCEEDAKRIFQRRIHCGREGALPETEVCNESWS
jgi:hypothetical protein